MTAWKPGYPSLRPRDWRGLPSLLQWFVCARAVAEVGRLAYNPGYRFLYTGYRFLYPGYRFLYPGVPLSPANSTRKYPRFAGDVSLSFCMGFEECRGSYRSYNALCVSRAVAEVGRLAAQVHFAEPARGATKHLEDGSTPCSLHNAFSFVMVPASSSFFFLSFSF